MGFGVSELASVCVCWGGGRVFCRSPGGVRGLSWSPSSGFICKGPLSSLSPARVWALVTLGGRYCLGCTFPKAGSRVPTLGLLGPPPQGVTMRAWVFESGRGHTGGRAWQWGGGRS